MIINVLVEQRVKNNDQLFSYLVPNSLIDKIKIGKRVLVPFGNKKVEGFILEILNDKQVDVKLKNIIDVIDEHPVLTDEMIELGKYISNIYLAPLISCYQTMLPVALKAKKNTKIGIKEEKYIKLNKPKDEIKKYIESCKFLKQKEILSLLLEKEIVKKKEIKSVSSLKILLEKGLVKEERKELYRLVDDYEMSDKEVKLTIDQQKVIDQVLNSDDSIFLLHGVTGSGKTEVYMRIIEKMISENKTAIVLVPEIALTTQLADNFKNRFGSKVAILHSRLSAGEKYDEWRKIERKEVSVVIGPRSAIFAPLTNIGIIVIDEEHESTYKQENSPRYNAIDIAIYRIKKHKAKMILGSATPSLESYARVKKGIYKLLVLDKRINRKALPKVNVVDMKDSIKSGNTLFSKELIDKINDRLSKKEQILLLLNRRGYATFVTCKNCGYTYKCPRCDITLTYHKTSGMTRCHYCGYADKKDDVCLKCHYKSISSYGVGTERIEEEIKKIFKDIRLVRMDLDTTVKKGSHQKIIKDFNDYKYDLLLGTQMIAKGLDFSRVTLVGVINGDIGLNIPDFRSGERTFQLLSQVAGRAGRDDLEGEVIFQTFNPDHYVIEMAKEHNYVDFYNKEMAIRKKLNYPPFCFICLIRILTKDYNLGFEEGKKIGNYLRKRLPHNQILGPTMASLLKVNNVYRVQCLIKFKKKEEILSILRKVLEHYENNHKIKIEIDFNPYKI